MVACHSCLLSLSHKDRKCADDKDNVSGISFAVFSLFPSHLFKFMSVIDSITQPVIVQIVPEMHKGGVERGTLEIAQAVIDKGWKAVVISHGGILTAQLKRMGAVSHELPVHSKNPLSWPSTRAKLAQILKQEGADIVHLRSRVPAWIALPVTKKLGIATVSTIHSKFAPSSMFKHIYNRKMLGADKVIVISDYVKSILETHYARHISLDEVQVIHRGVDTEIFDPKAVNQRRIVAEAERVGLPDDGQVVMLAGRPTSWKGYDILIEAVARLENDRLCLLLLGAGDGEPKFVDRLHQLALKTGLGGRVRIAGSSLDMPAAMMLADVVAMPSVQPEPFGRVAVEAQAMGRPVVAFAHGGAIESLLDQKTGWLATPGDVASLADALNSALSLIPSERAELAKIARQHMQKHFSKTQMCEKTLQIYQDLLDNA